MSDLGELIRDYYKSVADPVTVEENLYGAIGEGPVRPLGTSSRSATDGRAVRIIRCALKTIRADAKS